MIVTQMHSPNPLVYTSKGLCTLAVVFMGHYKFNLTHFALRLLEQALIWGDIELFSLSQNLFQVTSRCMVGELPA